MEPYQQTEACRTLYFPFVSRGIIDETTANYLWEEKFCSVESLQHLPDNEKDLQEDFPDCPDIKRKGRRVSLLQLRKESGNVAQRVIDQNPQQPQGQQEQQQHRLTPCGDSDNGWNEEDIQNIERNEYHQEPPFFSPILQDNNIINGASGAARTRRQVFTPHPQAFARVDDQHESPAQVRRQPHPEMSPQIGKSQIINGGTKSEEIPAEIKNCLKIPILSQSSEGFQLGSQYNIRKNKIIGLCIPDEELISSLSRQIQIEERSRIERIKADTISDRLDSLGIDTDQCGSLRVYTLLGLGKTDGTISDYLQHTNEQGDFERCALRYSQKTMIQYLDVQKLQNQNFYPDGKATHIVVGIDYGRECFCLLSEVRQKAGTVLNERRKDRRDVPVSSLGVRVEELLSKAQQGSISEYFGGHGYDQKTTCICFGDFSQHLITVKTMSDAIHMLQSIDNGRLSGAFPKTAYLMPVEKATRLQRPPTFKSLKPATVNKLGDLIDDVEQKTANLLQLAWSCSEELINEADDELGLHESVEKALQSARDRLEKALRLTVTNTLSGTNDDDERKLEQELNFFETALHDSNGLDWAIDLLRRNGEAIESNLRSLKDSRIPLYTSDEQLKKESCLALVWNLKTLEKKLQEVIDGTFKESAPTPTKNARKANARVNQRKQIHKRSAEEAVENVATATADIAQYAKSLTQEFLDFYENNMRNKQMVFATFLINNDFEVDDEHPLVSVYLIENPGREWKRVSLPTQIAAEDIEMLESTPSTITLKWISSSQNYPMQNIDDSLVKEYCVLTYLVPDREQQMPKKAVGRRLIAQANNKPEPLLTEATGNVVCSYRIEILDENTSYKFSIKPLCKFDLEVNDSELSEEFLTKKEDRRALRLKDRAQQIVDHDAYQPTFLLSREKVMEKQGLRKFVIGSRKSEMLTDKVILVVGGTGSGKTTLINSFANYLYDVRRSDDFRFKVVPPMEDGDDGSYQKSGKSKTKTVTAYEFNDTVLKYRLTVLDTPGFADTEGLDNDVKARGYIKNWFNELSTSHDGVNRLDAVCIVIKSSETRITAQIRYELQETISLFGKDLEKNVLILYTFCDGDNPKAAQALTQLRLPVNASFSFNNCGIFANRDENQRILTFYWDMGMQSFKKFFEGLEKMKSSSVNMSKEVLEEREQLELQATHLSERVKEEIEHVKCISDLIRTISDNQAEIMRNKNYHVKKSVLKNRKIDISGQGQHTTTCLKCNFTCHERCIFGNNEEKMRCSAMAEHRGKKEALCGICPKKCLWSDHQNLSYVIQWYEEEQTETIEAMMERYNIANDEEDRVQALLMQLAMKLLEQEKTITKLVEGIRERLNRLDEIAMRPGLMTNTEYLKALIQTEKIQMRAGYQGRMAVLERHLNTMELIEKVHGGSDLIEEAAEKQTFEYLFKTFPKIAKQFQCDTYRQKVTTPSNEGFIHKLLKHLNLWT